MIPNPRVSVVIRSYQEERFIERLLIGLRHQSFRDFEIVLVDSGSTDRTVAIAESFGANVFKIAKADFSFGRSLNRGCEQARGEILVFASAHVYPTRNDWLETLLEPFSDPAVALVYGKQRGAADSKFSELRLFEQWFPDQSDSNQRHPFCNNANCAVRRSAWEAIRYDEMLSGLEDLAFAKEVQRRGGRIVYRADAEIIHVHDETWSSVRNRYRREAMALRQIEPGIRFGLFDFARLTAMHIAGDLLRARRGRVLRRQATSIGFFRFNQFWGTYLGHLRQPEMTAHIRERFYYPQKQPADPGEHGTDGPESRRPSDAGRIDYDALEDSRPLLITSTQHRRSTP